MSAASTSNQAERLAGERRFGNARASDLMTIWEDEHGVAAWVLADPNHKSFDAQVRPLSLVVGSEQRVKNLSRGIHYFTD